jgi:O-antigen/teichoic acid export membrane protein
VWRGTTWLVLGRVYGSLCTMAVLWVLAHRLEAAAFGRYTFYLAVFVLLDSLADFGTGQVAVQRSARDEDSVPEVLAATRRIRFGMGALGVVLVGGGALLFGEPGSGWILLASLYPVTHVMELSNTVFRTRIALGVPVIVRAVASTLVVAFVMLLVALGDREPAHMLCATAAGSATGNVILYLAARAHLPKRAPTHAPITELFVAALPLGIASLCQQAYFYVDNLFVRAWCGASDLGAYNIAVRGLSFMIMGALFLSQAAMPWLVREHREGRLGEATAKLAQPMFALAGFGTGLLVPWSAPILRLFGPHFDVASGSFRWLLGATAAIHAGAALMTALVAAGLMRSVLVIAALGLGVNVVANVVLVPVHGLEGAAAATLGTEAFVAAGAAFALARSGISVASGARAWGWLGGPIGFALAVWLSSWVARA